MVMTRTTSAHQLSTITPNSGVCSRVCISGVHGLLSGKMDTASPRVGLLPQFPRHQAVHERSRWPREILGHRPVRGRLQRRPRVIKSINPRVKSRQCCRNLASVVLSHYSARPRLTGPTLDRLTHRCKIIETKGENYRRQDASRRSRTRKS